MEKREPSCTLSRKINGVAIMENSMEVPQEIRNRTAIRSSNPTFGYLSERTLKRCLHSYVHCSIIHSSQDTETTNVH